MAGLKIIILTVKKPLAGRTFSIPEKELNLFVNSSIQQAIDSIRIWGEDGFSNGFPNV